MNMMKKELESQLKQYMDEIRDIHDAFEIYIHVYNLCHVEKNKEANVAPIFFYFTLKSLLMYVIISLAKLYEGYKGRPRSDRNVIKFLEFIESNLILFDISEEFRKTINCEYIVDMQYVLNHKKIISDHSQLIDKLLTWRDKCFAHNDEEYFCKLDLLIEENPININEFRELIETFFSIINSYSIAYDGSQYLIESFEGVFDIDNIFEIISKKRDI